MNLNLNEFSTEISFICSKRAISYYYSQSRRGIEGDERQTIGQYLHMKVYQHNGIRDLEWHDWLISLVEFIFLQSLFLPTYQTLILKTQEEMRTAAGRMDKTQIAQRNLGLEQSLMVLSKEAMLVKIM